jgi:hypothetical protein
MHFKKLQNFFCNKSIKNFPLIKQFFDVPFWSISSLNRRKWPFQTSKIQNFTGNMPADPLQCMRLRAGQVKFRYVRHSSENDDQE